MKRPNVKRMQRHMARSTPDRVTRVFDPWEMQHETSSYRRWLNHHIHMMAIKHPGWGMEIEIDRSMFGGKLYPGQALVVATARERR